MKKNQKARLKLQNENSKFKICVLGSGAFCDQIKTALSSKYILDCQKPDICIVANYGRKITAPELRRIPHLNVHASLLPKLKGSSPIQTAISQGLKQTGYTIIQLDEQIDHGPILAQGRVKIAPEDNFDSLGKKIAQPASRKLLTFVPLYLAGKIRPQPQDHSRETWTKKIIDQDRLITEGEIGKNPAAAERKIRALYPRPKAYILLRGKRLLIHRAKIKNGRLVLQKIQLEGRKAMSWQTFLRGWRHPLTKVLKFN